MNKEQRTSKKIAKARKRHTRKVVSGMNNHAMANDYFYRKKLGLAK